MSDLPPGWEWATLGELGVEAQPGFASGKHNRNSDGVLHLRPMNITRDGNLDLADARYVQDDSRRRVCQGDVLFNNTNSPDLVGKTAIVTSISPVAYSNHMTRLRPPVGLDAVFLARQLYWLWTSGYFKSVLSHHVNQASVSSKVLLQTRIVVPPSTEQRRIVAAFEDHLSRLDGGRASLWSAQRRAVVAVHSRVKSLLEDLVPHRTLGSVLREPLRNGYSGRASQDGSGVRTLTLTAVTKAQFIDEYTKNAKINGRKIDDLWLEPGDLLVQRSNTAELVGTSALYAGPRNWAIFPDLLIRVRTNHEVLPAYAHLVLSSPRVHRVLRRSAKGLAGSMPKIDQGTLEGLLIPVPPVATQERIVQLAEEFNRKLKRLRAELAVTENRGESLRRSLLADAFAGRLVSQDSGDEPASVLLERIRAERAEAPKPGRMRRTNRPATTQEALL